MRVLILFLLLLLSTVLPAQTNRPYHLSLKRELLVAGGGALTLGLGTYLQSQLAEPLRSELANTRYDQINAFDRLGTNVERGNARKWSDRLLNTGAGLPALLLLAPHSRRDFGTVALLYVETMALAGGLTNLTKAGFARPRPYVYAPDWDPARRLSSGDQASFASGHTSLAATGAFFFARVFADYHPDSRLRPLVWGVAATLPAVTGYLRIRAARHYPSDVIAGYLLGASMGYLVPALHRREVLPRGMRVRGGPAGVGLDWRF